MAHISADIRLRPIRFAFLVRPDDSKRTLEILRANTCLWGGKYNPIIPIFKRVPEWWDRQGHRFYSAPQIINGYLDFFEPDFLVESEKGLADGLGFDNERVLQLADLFAKDNDHSREGHGMNVFELYRELYRKEFQFTLRHGHDIVNTVPELPSFKLFSAVLFGAFPIDPELTYISNGFNEAFAPKKITLNGATLNELYQSGFTSALRVGHAKIEVDFHDHNEPILFVMNAHYSRDIIDFWNLRAVRRQVIPIPIQWINDLTDFCKSFITDNYRPLPNNQHGVMTHSTVMFSRSIPTAEITPFYERHFRVDIQGASLIQDWYPPVWRPSPSFTVREMRPTLTALQKRIDIQVTNERPEIRFDNLYPEFSEEYGNSNRWANVIQLRDWTNEDRIATVFPCDYKKPEFPKFGFGHSPALPTTEGFVIFPHYRSSSEYWVLEDGSTIINNWLKARGVQATLSDAGRATQQIINTLGGFWGTGSLAHQDIVKYLNKISRRPGSRSAQHQEFRNTIEGAIKGNIWRKRNFETLVERNAVELGLELCCSKCSSWSWYSMKQLDDQMSCSLCLKQFSFPTIDPGHKKNSRWAYRLIGPFALPNYANGGYAAALSIRFFASVISRLRDTDVTWSAGQELNFAPNEKLESDFIIWYQRKAMFGNNYPTDLIFGEAKSFRGETSEERKAKSDAFEVEDIERMKKLAIRFPGSILVFSTMKKAEHLSEKELVRIRKLAEWGREYVRDRQQTRAPVIVLTGTELFSAYSLHLTWGEIGDRHAQVIQHGMTKLDNLRVLADLTQQLYLDMPSYGEWSRARWEKRAARQLARTNQVA